MSNRIVRIYNSKDKDGTRGTIVGCSRVRQMHFTIQNLIGFLIQETTKLIKIYLDKLGQPLLNK